MSKKVFGIDLGTTYSCISYIDESGRPVVIKNMEGSNTTPSVIFFDNEEEKIVVGQVAKDNAALYPDNVVNCIKRSMGQEGYSFYQNGRNISAEELSSYILKKVVTDAEQIINEKIEDVVITCPAYFGINERTATKSAGEIAGLNVLQIVNEPTAAAVCYGSTESTDNKVILVYDLGGGTFDITMISVNNGNIDVICTDGDHNLGGKNWDDAMMAYVAEEFREKSGISDDILDNYETIQDLTVKVEQAKKQLTQRAKTVIVVDHEGNRERIEITREKFEELTAPLLERTIELSKNMLEEAAKKGYTSYDEIILVGGSTRMPQVIEKVKREFDKEPRMFDPDEAVAKGAAIIGSYKTIGSTEGTTAPGILGGKTEAPVINNVVSKSFGVITYSSQEDRESISNIITKNTSIPTSRTKNYSTIHVNQESVLIRICENGSSDEDCAIENGKEIGTATLMLPAGLPAGAPLEITFKINEDGILEMTANEKTENRTVSASIKVTTGLSESELGEAKKHVDGITIE